MPLYKKPDFNRLPAGLAAVFDQSGQCSFFALPQWYDLLARTAVAPGNEVRVYTDERHGSTVALLLQATLADRGRCLASLANFYSVEHGLIAAPGADLDQGL